VALVRQAKYRGAGTVEFLLAPDGAFYFLEMNTRLQVEHPVTESVTGIDLVRAQIVVAAERRLPFAQDEITRRGHAIEARVYAEDASRHFLPQAGTASRVRWPRAPFVRIDAGIESGGEVPVHYDPILAKIIAFGVDRDSALRRLAAALDETVVHGVITNLPFLKAMVRDPAVERGAFDTEWIEREFLAGFVALATAPAPDLVLVAAAIGEVLGGGQGSAAGSGDARVDPAESDPFASAGPWRLPGLD
jgi:acetyl/propionyl-CoA carboxylase alpha subunit